VRNGTPKIASLARTLAMLDAVIADGGRSSVAAIARSIAMPVATAHRQVVTLVAEGYLAASESGGHVAGPRLLDLLYRLDEKQVIANVAAAVLHRLAARVGCVVQLGTFENDMVTYRIKAGQGAGALFTKVGMQLEAYCSGIGKVLLAYLPDDQRRAYLAGGPFVALTSHTITGVSELAEELARIRSQGFAVDNGEIAEDLLCIAAPVRTPAGNVPAAISISQDGSQARLKPVENFLPLLFEAADEIERIAFVQS
jgi:IclR family transcriptional regulator, acetate operon repressor